MFIMDFMNSNIVLMIRIVTFRYFSLDEFRFNTRINQFLPLELINSDPCTISDFSSIKLKTFFFLANTPQVIVL